MLRYMHFEIIFSTWMAGLYLFLSFLCIPFKLAVKRVYWSHFLEQRLTWSGPKSKSIWQRISSNIEMWTSRGHKDNFLDRYTFWVLSRVAVNFHLYASPPVLKKPVSRETECYLQKRGSRKVLARSRNLGSVFDGSRSLVFEWFLRLGVLDLSFFLSIWSSGVELFQSSWVRLIELSW